MKILNVRIKNINSLAGDHEIEFDKPPLNEVGIFAITGPNGSGKTTILDAICLALYGQTPRLKTQSEEVMNKNTSDCFAEVTFALNDQRYRSRWSAQRSGGAFHTRMQLTGINGEETVLKETVNSVREEISRLTGLDFKRFSRSVMLPQGQFAAFLHALSNERIEVIDKIVGSEAYQDHCEAIRKSAESANERLLFQKETLAQMPRPEMDPSLAEDLETAEKAYLAAESDLDNLKNEKDLIQRHESDKQAYQENQIALSSALARKEGMMDEIRRLERAKAAAAFEADLAEHETQAAAAGEQESRFTALTEAIEKHKKDLAELSERAQTTRKDLDETEQRQAAGAETLEAAIAADSKVNAAAEAFRSLVDRYEKLEREQKENLQAQAKAKDDIAQNESDRAATEKWIEKHRTIEKLKEATPRILETVAQLKSVREEIEQNNSRRQESLQQLESARTFLKKARDAHAKSLGKVETLKARKAGQEETAVAILADVSPEDFETGVDQNIRRLKNCRQLLKTAKGYKRQMSGNGGSVEETLHQKEDDLAKLDDAFEAKQIAMVNFEKKIKFDDERSQLTPELPCPLCGSLDHPYAADASDAKNARKMFKGMKKELKKLLKTRKRLVARIKDLQKRLERIDAYTVKWKNLCEDTGNDWPIGDVAAVKQALKAVKQEVRSGKKALKIVKRREGKSKKMTQAVETASEKLQERQAFLRENEGEVAIHRKLLATIEQESAEMAKQESAFAASLLQTVEEFGETVPNPGAEDAFILNISARTEEYRTRQNRLVTLAEAAERLRDQIQRLPEALKALKTEAEALEGQIEERQKILTRLKAEREAQFGTDDPVREKMALAEKIEALTGELEQIQLSTESATSALSEAEIELEGAREAYDRAKTAYDTVSRLLQNKVIATSVFRNLDEVRESFISAEEKGILETHVNQVEEEIRLCRQELEKLKISSRNTPSTRSAAEVDLAIDDEAKRLDLLKDDLDRLTETYEAASRAEALYVSERNKLEALQKRSDELNAMTLAIASEDDARVKRGFHEEVFQKLLVKTRGYVGMLNDQRYTVCQSEKDPFGLEVEVAGNGDTTRRPVESLSGGETFLIGLSMALALSDLTDGSRRIQSLFIDEGFGYLDDENLTQVINTLNDHLKANGKRVGVISHVSRLDDEFQTKVQVIPEKGGKTRLEVLPKEKPLTVE